MTSSSPPNILPSKPQDLNWAVIREQYETSNVSIIDLARRWGLKSRNTLYRKIEAEGWTRRVGEIAAHMAIMEIARDEQDHREEAVLTGQVLQAIARGKAPPPEPGESSRPESRSDSQPSGAKPQQSAGSSTAPPRDSTSSESPSVEAERVTPDEAQALRNEAADAVDLTSARLLAGLHSERVRAQLRLAGELQDLGMRITRRVSALLDAPEDEPGQQLVVQATRRLIAISPERETLAGLVKAAAEVVNKGVILERRALGMDVLEGHRVPAAADVPHVAIGPAAVDLVRQLDEGLGKRLREFALEAVRARREAMIAAQRGTAR